MSTLTARLAASKQTMYSKEGAEFQEWALNRLDRKGSRAHQMIGILVTQINNNKITVAEAEVQFTMAKEA